MASIVEESSTKSARDHLATLALSIYQIHRLPAPGTDELGSIVLRAEASMGRAQLRHPENITAPAIAEINQLVLRAADAKARPANIYSAEGARSEAAGGAPVRKSGIDADRLEQSRFSRQQVQDAAAGNAGASDASSSGARYDGMSSSDWGSPAGLAKMRDYAIQSGLSWAANNPDLLRLGPAAIGALAAVHLKGDGYDGLHGKDHLNFDNRTIVAGADYMKRNHADYNEAAKAAAAVDGLKQLSPEERELHRQAEKGLLTSKPGQSEADAKNRFIETGDQIIRIHHGDKHVVSAVERERKAHHVQKQQEHKAEMKADSADQHTAIKVAHADLKAAHNEQLAQADGQAKAGAKSAKAALGAALG